MSKRKTHSRKTSFEQIPITVAKKIAEDELNRFSGQVLCSLCGDPVRLENCKIDEYGKAVHDHCYLTRTAEFPHQAEVKVANGRGTFARTLRTDQR
jgi:hypothetical protein